MADDNKPMKYMRYAIGEIALVVVGILIALSINNWNQNRLNIILEAKYYERLLEDFKEEKEIIQATLNYSHQVSLHAKNAIAIFENPVEISSNPVENLIDMYQASQLRDPNSATSTYKELIASGQINLIQNDSLKTALIRYYEIEWPEIDVFKIPNNYRENLRGKMPNIIQTEIRTKCGDVYYKIRKGFEVALPKTCEVDIEIDVAQPVVEFLRNDKSLKMDLRYLIGNENAKIKYMNSTKRQLEDLIALFENLGNK
jgi:hypothetical protein